MRDFGSAATVDADAKFCSSRVHSAQSSRAASARLALGLRVARLAPSRGGD